MKIISRLLIAFFITFFIQACSSGGSGSSSVKATKTTVILVFGDSLSAGYGTATNGQYFQFVTPGQAWAELLQSKINSTGMNSQASVTVVNSSLGGEFSSEALARIPSVLASVKPTHVIIGHGTNDAWSNLNASSVGNNIASIANKARAAGAKTIVLSYRFNIYGDDYANTYQNALNSAAASSSSTFVNATSGISYNSQYYHSDGVHLNDAAQSLILENVWSGLTPLID